MATTAPNTSVETPITTPEKVALSKTSTVCETTVQHGHSASSTSTPRSDRTVNPFDADMEACVTNDSLDKGPRGSVQFIRNKDCQVWPDQKYWKKRAKAAKKNRSCAPLAGLSRRNKLIAKVAIILLIVGIAVGVGFGVSKPLGASIWGKSDNS